MDDQRATLFRALRSPQGERLVLEENAFVERVLPASILRDLSGEEMDYYRLPYLQAGEGRRPTLTWPRDLPIDGEPADVVTVVADYANWLADSDVPKLFINAEPGPSSPARYATRSDAGSTNTRSL
jgi:haloalkane dehalogenase